MAHGTQWGEAVVVGFPPFHPKGLLCSDKSKERVDGAERPSTLIPVFLFTRPVASTAVSANEACGPVVAETSVDPPYSPRLALFLCESMIFENKIVCVHA